MIAEEELRARLQALAERAGHPRSAGADVARRIARDTADRRRTRRRLLTGAGVVLVLAVALPRVDDSRTAVPATTTEAASVPETRAGAAAVPLRTDVLGSAPRGSLAGDRAFVDGVRRLVWTQGPPPPADDGTVYYLPDPPVETRSVVFAGEVSTERWALVVGWVPGVPAGPGPIPGEQPAPDQPVAAWFTGPADAGPEQMTLRSGPSGISPDWPIAVTDPLTGNLVVITAPGDEVEVSARPVVTADAITTREWREVETVEGIAITRVPPFPRPWDASTSYRVLRGGLTVARDMPWSFPHDTAAAPVQIGYPRGRPSALGEQAAQLAAEHVLAELGLSTAQVEVTAHWVGSVPPDGAGQGAVVSVTLPSGAVVVQAHVLLPETSDGGAPGAFCGQDIQPAGAPAARRVQAVTCEVFEPVSEAPISRTLVVVGPPEVTLIRTYDDDRTFLGEHPAVDGVTVVPLPQDTDTVEAVTGGGVTLGRVELLGHAVDFGD